MHVISVPTGRAYEVRVGTFLLEQVGAAVRGACRGGRAAIVTDSNVGPLYAEVVRRSIAEAGMESCTYTFEAGEASKRAGTYVDLLEFLAAGELGRSDAVVALGGGVVGDLAGFAAATYLRGIAYVQVPTSLLAMVDSSVGGKTAIDLEAGKNLAGAFWQPSAVLADVGALGTLSAEQFADGCGEVVKHGVIADPALFEALEAAPLTLDLLMRSVSAVGDIVACNVEIKRDVVAADEREAGARKLLNFGHSIGHAVEALEGYRLGHGTCVAAGMRLITRAAEALGVCEQGCAARIEAVCRAQGIHAPVRFGAEEIFQATLHDKKRHGEAIDLVIPHAIGDCEIVSTPLPEFRRIIELGLAAERTEGAYL